MNVIEIILIALSLSMDAFAVSISKGLTIQSINLKQTLTIALFFGSFQALMPYLGWALGVNSFKYISSFNYWLAFILLFIIGFKMIKEAFECKKEEGCFSKFSYKEIFFLAIATSIDAFASGISFACLNIKILKPILIIGLVTFLFSVLGVKIGKIFSEKYQKISQISGGAILILIGLKIILEHYLGS